MRDDDVRRALREMNPWWRAADTGNPLGWVEADLTLRRARELGIEYRPSILDDVVDGGLYVVRGPRRVGKSVAVKRFAADTLASRGISPWQVIYLAVDGFDTRALRRALRLGRDLTTAAGDQRRIWIIDEITAVDDWPATLKSDRDNTPFGRDTVVLTGSSAHGLQEARRALGAGRVGEARNPFRVLMPMTFREFCRVADRGVPELPIVDPTALQSAAVRDALATVPAYVDELDLAWQTYCEVGGFPRAVGEYARHGQVADSFATDLVDWLAPDVTPDDPPESILRVLEALNHRTGAPLNITATARTASMTRDRLTTRLNRLTATLAAIWCPQVDQSGLPVPSSQSKLYLIDPLLMQLPHLIDGSMPPPSLTAVTEAALATALSRSIESLHPGRLLEGRTVGYFRTGGGNEVDFAPMPLRVGGIQTMSVPTESKWVSQGWRREALTVENRFGSGVLATKDIFDLDHKAWALPAAAVALLLG